MSSKLNGFRKWRITEGTHRPFQNTQKNLTNSSFGLSAVIFFSRNSCSAVVRPAKIWRSSWKSIVMQRSQSLLSASSTLIKKQKCERNREKLSHKAYAYKYQHNVIKQQLMFCQLVRYWPFVIQLYILIVTKLYDVLLFWKTSFLKKKLFI